MIKAVIFDMDGLLIDSEPFWQEAEIKVFATVGLQLTHKMCTQTMGLRIDEVVDYWYQRQPWKNKPKQEVVQEVIAEVERLVYAHGKSRAGVQHIIAYMQAKGVKIALASSSAKKLIVAVISTLKIGDRFDVICSAQDEEYGKPHPAVFLTTAQKLGIQPTECLVFEDSLNGLIAAKSARMKTVMVPEKADYDNARMSLADVKLQSLAQFTEDHWQQLNH